MFAPGAAAENRRAGRSFGPDYTYASSVSGSGHFRKSARPDLLRQGRVIGVRHRIP